MKNKKQSLNIYLITATCLLVGLTQTVQANILYGADRNKSGGASVLHSIDTNSGKVTAIGSVGYSVVDLAWDRTGNKLFGAVIPERDRPASTFTGLITIDTTTGIGTPIGETRDNAGNITKVLQIDIDSKGNMYGTPNQLSFPYDTGLLSLDSTTGSINSITEFLVYNPRRDREVALNIGKDGFSFDSSDLLWRDRDSGGSGDHTIEAVSTDLATSITSPEITYVENNLTGGVELEGDVGNHGTFDLSTDLYWAVLDNKITMHDMATGELKGTLDLVNAPPISGLDQYKGIRALALAFASPIPVPAAIWLFGSGLIGLISFSKRQQA